MTGSDRAPVVRRTQCRRHAVGGRSAARLTEEAERRMIAEYQVSRNTLLVGPIVKHNLDWLNRVARRYLKLSGNTRVYKDLVGVGVLELIRVLKDYRPSGAADFAAHADPHVRRAILKELHRFNATRTVRDVWRRLADITFVQTCRNCMRQCVF